MKINFILIIYLSCLTLTGFAQQKIALLEPRVGEGSSAVSSMEKAMVRGELRKAIVNFPDFEAITRTDIDQMMKEFKFQQTGMVSEEQIKKVGEMSGADFICVSTLTKSNTEFYLEAYLIHLESGIMSNPASQYGELMDGKLANMLPVCQALAQELLGFPTTTNSFGNSTTSRTKKDYVEKAFGVNMKMIWVEGGEFMMGCTSEQGNDCEDDEKNVRRVAVNGFYIGMLEVTQAQWEKVVGEKLVKHYEDLTKENMVIVTEDNYDDYTWFGAEKIGDTVFPSVFWYPIRQKPDIVDPNFPMYDVRWNDAVSFCRQLSEKTGRKYMLPTEAQWEYAARGGNQADGNKFAGDNVIEKVAWCHNNSQTMHLCGTLQSNPLGIYDMSGNVWEWCSDYYSRSYLSYDTYNPSGSQDPEFDFEPARVIRGGAWDSKAEECRVSKRSRATEGDFGNWLGFRVVCVP